VSRSTDGAADGTAAAANPFGIPTDAEPEFDPADLQLPADLSKFLK
jgi:hypothetical protein